MESVPFERVLGPVVGRAIMKHIADTLGASFIIGVWMFVKLMSFRNSFALAGFATDCAMLFVSRFPHPLFVVAFFQSHHSGCGRW